MAKEANLIVNITVNPPQLFIVGPIKETTIAKLNEVLPNACTSMPGQKAVFSFEKKNEPPHYFGQLPGSYANEDIGQTRIFLALLDCLEEEGGWKLKGSNATNHDVSKTTYKLFFVRKL
eukprot:PhM_4_TR6780/c0_g1_i1/m.96210